MFINLEMYIIIQVSLNGQGKMESRDVDFYLQTFHWLFENVARDPRSLFDIFGPFQ